MVAEPASATFYDLVYAYLERVPPGKVVTYGQVAFELGAPRASRAVGYALHNLPPSSDVPWWRVVNANGRISLGSRGGAADEQRVRLDAEGVQFTLEGHIRLREFRWATAK